MFHINPNTGKPGTCTATVRDCKYAQGDLLPEHYATAADARKAYEKSMGSGVAEVVTKYVNPERFDDILTDITSEVEKIKELALGPRQSKAVEALDNATKGKWGASRRHAPGALDAMEELKNAKRHIGKANPGAYSKIDEMIKRVENSAEIKRDSYYQTELIFKKAKLPKGAKRMKGSKYISTYIELEGGNEVHPHIPVKQGQNGTINFALKTPTGRVLKESSNIQDLF